MDRRRHGEEQGGERRKTSELKGEYENSVGVTRRQKSTVAQVQRVATHRVCFLCPVLFSSVPLPSLPAFSEFRELCTASVPYLKKVTPSIYYCLPNLGTSRVRHVHTRVGHHATKVITIHIPNNINMTLERKKEKTWRCIIV